MNQERRCVLSELMPAFMDLYDQLVNEGLSPLEAMERLFMIFDWEAKGAKKRVIEPREDEFAESEESRNGEADQGVDLAALWIEARERGDGSERFIEKLIGLE